MRITLENVKKHKFFVQPEGHEKFWKAIQTKSYKGGIGPLIPKQLACNNLPADLTELETVSNVCHQAQQSQSALPRPQD